MTDRFKNILAVAALVVMAMIVHSRAPQLDTTPSRQIASVEQPLPLIFASFSR